MPHPMPPLPVRLKSTRPFITVQGINKLSFTKISSMAEGRSGAWEHATRAICCKTYMNSVRASIGQDDSSGGDGLHTAALVPGPATTGFKHYYLRGVGACGTCYDFFIDHLTSTTLATALLECCLMSISMPVSEHLVSNTAEPLYVLLLTIASATIGAPRT
jgi:hypothetical protein